MKKLNRFFVSLSAAFCLCLGIGAANAAFAQQQQQQQSLPPTAAADRAKALTLAEQNLYLPALPLLEKVAPLYPKDAEVWAHYGIAIITRSVTMTAPEARKEELIKGYNVLVKARELGTKNVIALNFLDTLSPDGNGADNFSGDPEFEKNLREGEAFFSRGEYDKSFVSYEKAYKIDPKSYEAVLFMGDSLYAAGKYKESEIWFAKAVELAPNREQAYRFWGDALMNQKKTLEARDKFVEALISDPGSRLTWERFARWAEETGTPAALLEITPPGNESAGAFQINEALLKADDGTISWKSYAAARKSQIIATGGGKRTLAGEKIALGKTAASFRSDLKAGKIKNPDQSLMNLVKLDDDGLLEPYILLIRGDEDIVEEYENYLAKNRSLLKRFVVEYFLKTGR